MDMFAVASSKWARRSMLLNACHIAACKGMLINSLQHRFQDLTSEQRWLRSSYIFSAHAAIYTHSGGLPPAKTEHFSGNMILDPRLRKLYLLLDKRLHLVGVSHILLHSRRNLIIRLRSISKPPEQVESQVLANAGTICGTLVTAATDRSPPRKGRRHVAGIRGSCRT
jgi:hypothetical protein